ncbi:hypothetical protein MCHI_002692 [Candidatus Magnetoovum chiemensis]|nr:hypothetical protein MCHI_002692 [Candidatus Magnetoovum chiemensis]
MKVCPDNFQSFVAQHAHSLPLLFWPARQSSRGLCRLFDLTISDICQD